MALYYTLRVSKSDMTVSGKSKVPDLYVKTSFGDESCRTSSVNRLPPEWNETFPIACTCSDNENMFTIKLMKEGLIDTSIGRKECSLKELLRENGEDVRIPLQSKSGSCAIFLCLRTSDKMKNAELTLVNLAHTLLDIHPSSHGDFAEDVNAIFDTAKRIAESKACQSLVKVGYTITAFVEFGNSIADASPYLKLTWCITTAFLNIIATQINTDKRIRELIKNLMGLFSVIKDTSVFNNPSASLRLYITDILEFITQCSILVQDYARKRFIGKSNEVRAILQNRRSAIDDLDATLIRLKTDLISAFERQGIIEAQIRALGEELEKKLQPKYEAGHDRQRCLVGTQTRMLEEIEEWVQDRNSPNVFFILGNAGTGKSTIATTVAETFRGSRLGSHQYFIRGKSSPAFIFRTIAYGLAKRNQAVARAIKERLDDFDIDSATPDKAFEVLLYEPLHAVAKREGLDTNVLTVLDALDECGDREARRPYIRLIKEKLQILPPNYRFLITSRPEEDIGTLEALDKLKIRVKLLDHESKESKDDVLRYIESELGKLRADGRILVEPGWSWNESMKILGEAAGGLFIWATTAVKLVESRQEDMGGELRYLVREKSLSLEKLYDDVLGRSLDWTEDTSACFSRVFSLIMFGKEQLSGIEIDDLLGLGFGKSHGILNSLHSLIAFERGQPVRLYHTSLYDYLVSKRTSGKPWFIDEKKEKMWISIRCLELMKGLQFNSCRLKSSYHRNMDVQGLRTRVSDEISASLRYSCRHWASHIREVPFSEYLCIQVDDFVFNRFLYWIEVLSLTDSVFAFLLPSLENAISWLEEKCTHLSEFIRDAHYQLLRFIEPISQSTPHIYMTFLPLLQKDSIVAKHYAKRAQSLTDVEYIGNKPQMACVKHINVSRWINSISYSPDSKRIASGSWAGVISVWDAITGEVLLGPLHGHSETVTSIAYSEDGRYITSGSEDKTIRVWNALTGESVLGPLVGHLEKVNSVAISRDGKYIASGSDDNTTQLWSTESGAPVGDPLRGHSSSVRSVVFSPNGCYLSSGSEDYTIIIWDIHSRSMITDPFEGHSDSVTSLSFSPDSEKIASGSLDGTIRVWEVSTGVVLRKFSEGNMGRISSLAYSHDGKRILSGSYDKILRLWNVEDNDTLPRRFEGHTSIIKSVSFAPDNKHFASGSYHGTIRVWDVEKGVEDSLSVRQTEAIRATAISPKTGKFLVSGSDDSTVCVWNEKSGKMVKGPLQGNSWSITSVAFSSDEIHFASGSADESVHIWNMIDDNYVTCNGHTGWVFSVAFSPDGKHLASGSSDSTIRIWNVERGSLDLTPLTGHTSWVCSVCYTFDGKKIISGSNDTTVRIWNASNGILLSTFEGHSRSVNSVACSVAGYCAVSGSSDRTIQVWNTETSQAMYGPITGHTDTVSSVCFSPDGRWILSGSDDKTVCIWDVANGDLFFQARVSSPVKTIASFPMADSNYIKFASGSWDGTIHIWSVNIGSEKKKWLLEDNGWLVGNDNDLLIWIPPDLRHSLVNGPCIRTLNTRFSTKLDLSVKQGAHWTACFPSPNGHIS